MEIAPSLSVVLVTGYLRKLSRRVLRSLLEQDMIDQMEIIIVDCVSSDMPPFPGSDHSNVRVIMASQAIEFGKAMVMGIHAARAPIVALLEEHCVVLPGWAQALVNAHKEPWGAVCGEVINGNPRLGVSDAEFFATRPIRWQSPAERSRLPMIDGKNSAFKRDILLSYGNQLELMLHCEAVMLLRMKEDGFSLLLEPAAKYIHVNEASLHTLPSSLYYWHRRFGHSRAVIFQWSMARRFIRLAILLFLPEWNCAGTLFYILEKRRDQLWIFFKNLPMIVFLHYCASAGQMMGLLFGEGTQAKQFSERERGIERVPRTDLIAQE